MAKRHLNIEVRSVQCSDKEGFQTKLQLDKLAGRRPCLFFDADLWFLRDWDVAALMGAPTVMGVHDSAVFNHNAFCHTDCMENGLEWARYINSGLMIFDFQRQEHRDVFIHARRVNRGVKSGRVKTADLTDQFAVNQGILRAGVAQTLLPIRFNTYTKAVQWGQFPFYPREIVGLHAAGYPREEKYDALKRESAVFSATTEIMLPGSMNFEFHRWFEIR